MAGLTVSCVLRAGPAFQPVHVEWLGRQVAQYFPGATFTPFSDVPLSIGYRPLCYGLPSWWSKMEAYQSLKEGQVLMLDIDTVIASPPTGILTPVPREGTAFMPQLPRCPGKWMGGWQLSSESFRHEVQSHFFSDPERWITESNGDDQKYYADHFEDRLDNVNKAARDLCASYKLQVMHHGLWPQTSFVMFHGLPRPWDLDEPWIPKL